MDVDNVTIPTTLEGLCRLIPPYIPVHLNNEPASNKDLPSYFYVGSAGFSIYAKATQTQKVVACEAISAYGPPIKAHNAPGIFSHSRTQVSCGLLCDAFLHAKIDNVAIFAYGMKELIYCDTLSDLPLSTDPEVCRRYDIGVNKILSTIPFFDVDDELRNCYSGRVFRMCGELGAGGGSIRYRYSSPHQLIFASSYVTVYPRILHQVKMRLHGKKYIPAKINGKVNDSKYLLLFTFLLLQVARGRLYSYQDYWMSWMKKWTRVR